MEKALSPRDRWLCVLPRGLMNVSVKAVKGACGVLVV